MNKHEKSAYEVLNKKYKVKYRVINNNDVGKDVEEYLSWPHETIEGALKEFRGCGSCHQSTHVIKLIMVDA